MSDFNSWLVSDSFRVNDTCAVKKVLMEYGVEEANITIKDDGYMSFGKEGDFYCTETEDTTKVIETIKEHLVEDSVCYICGVGHEKLKYVDFLIIVITKDVSYFEHNHSIKKSLMEKIKKS